jgi:hypothetical protein
MSDLRLENQLGEGKPENTANFVARPVVAKLRHRSPRVATAFRR